MNNNILLSLMRECRNFFVDSYESGVFVLSNKKISLANEYKIGQYLLLTGSILNDGVYKITDISSWVHELEISEDIFEVWDGTIYALRIPPDFLQLAAEIQTFLESPGGAISPYISETVLNVHSWARATNKDTGAPAGWQIMFADKLSPFRRMFTTIDI